MYSSGLRLALGVQPTPRLPNAKILTSSCFQGIASPSYILRVVVPSNHLLPLNNLGHFLHFRCTSQQALGCSAASCTVHLGHSSLHPAAAPGSKGACSHPLTLTLPTTLDLRGAKSCLFWLDLSIGRYKHMSFLNWQCDINMRCCGHIRYVQRDGNWKLEMLRVTSSSSLSWWIRDCNHIRS